MIGYVRCFKLGFLDSKSSVFTFTPWDRPTGVGGNLFKKVAAVARLRKKNLRPTDKIAKEDLPKDPQRAHKIAAKAPMYALVDNVLYFIASRGGTGDEL